MQTTIHLSLDTDDTIHFRINGDDDIIFTTGIIDVKNSGAKQVNYIVRVQMHTMLQ